MAHYGMVDNTLTEQRWQFSEEEILKKEEGRQGFFSEAVITMIDPVICVGDKEELRLQGHIYH